MNIRKLVGFIAIALLIFFVVTRPESAAQSVENIASILSNVANSVSDFFTALV
ncbi:MAG: hypothetical protein L0H64_09990 [Pseudonocardia sp.]|nr:hypothetical protein [Pseudonocardia sp.]